MVNLRSYVVMKEELDADNLDWKYTNWYNQLSEEDQLNVGKFFSDNVPPKDVKQFKELVDKSGINFNALTDVMADDAKGLPDNYDNIYILKKIVDTINVNNKKRNKCND